MLGLRALTAKHQLWFRAVTATATEGYIPMMPLVPKAGRQQRSAEAHHPSIESLVVEEIRNSLKEHRRGKRRACMMHPIARHGIYEVSCWKVAVIANRSVGLLLY